MSNLLGAQRTAVNAAMSSVAKTLASPDGANAEYDRALVDLLSAVLGIAKAEGARMTVAAVTTDVRFLSRIAGPAAQGEGLQVLLRGP